MFSYHPRRYEITPDIHSKTPSKSPTFGIWARNVGFDIGFKTNLWDL